MLTVTKRALKVRKENKGAVSTDDYIRLVVNDKDFNSYSEDAQRVIITLANIVMDLTDR